MNIYEKLNAMRMELQGRDIKKTGVNEYAKYDYMELGDFLPHINEILSKHKVASVISFGLEQATLELVNAENPDERIAFTSPMSKANLKGCHDVQNLGAVQTYLRRYLYIAAFEIVESDALDAGQGNVPGGDGKPVLSTIAQRNTVLSAARNKGYGPLEVEAYARKKYGVDFSKTTAKQADEMLVGYSNIAPKKTEESA